MNAKRFWCNLWESKKSLFPKVHITRKNGHIISHYKRVSVYVIPFPRLEKIPLQSPNRLFDVSPKLSLYPNSEKSKYPLAIMKNRKFPGSFLHVYL